MEARKTTSIKEVEIPNTPWLTLKQGAAYAGVGYERMVSAAENEELKIGHPPGKFRRSKIRIHTDNLDKWMEADFEIGLDRESYITPTKPSWYGKEAELRDYIRLRFDNAGYRTEVENFMPCGGRSDLLAHNSDGSISAIVEVKVHKPLKGVGQLLAYCHAVHPKPNLILAVDSHTANGMESHACSSAGIEMWVADGKTLFAHPRSESEVLSEIAGDGA